MISARETLNSIHAAAIFRRRVRVLALTLSKQIPPNASLLDVGTGDGSIAAAIKAHKPDVQIEGIDVLIRPLTDIRVRFFDGEHIPFDDQSFDVVSFVDVLHHTSNPKALLRESVRVSRSYVLIKDHLREGLFADITLRLMDWIGNRGHGVALPYNYLSKREWRQIIQDVELEPQYWCETIGLYPFPFSLVFERRLHFVTLLRKPSSER